MLRYSESSGAVLSSTKEAALTILSWAKESSDVFPPLKSTLGSVLFIAELVDKFRSNKKQWRELGIFIAKEISKLKDKMEGLDLSSPGKYTSLELKLESLSRELDAIKEDIEALASRSWSVRVVQTLSDSERIVGFRERIQACMISSLMDANFEILRGVKNLESLLTLPSAPLEPDFAVLVPEKPRIFHGREEELKTILSYIRMGVNARNPARIAICGSGGLGKTSLALSVLHHDEAKAQFDSHRYFVSCETTDTPSLLLSAINRALGSTQGNSDPLLQLKGYVQNLGKATLLILDNFETAWDGEDQDGMQRTISILDSSQYITLLLTSRVIVLPRGIVWTKFPPLQPFNLDAARQTFNDIVGEVAGDHSYELDELLQQLDRVPLAVTLMASTAQSGESIAELRGAWDRERTAMLASGSSSKNGNLEVSIKISLDSKAVQANPGAIRLLSALCILPDGAERGSLGQITTITHPDSAVRTLKTVSLIHEEQKRLRVLSPIRAYIFSQPDLQLHNLDSSALVQYYIELARKAKHSPDNKGFIPACQTLSPEQGNIHSILSMAMHEQKGPPSLDLAQVLERYAQFLNLTSPNPGLLKQMVEIQNWGLHLSKKLQADIRLCLGETYCHIGALDQAQEQLEQTREFCMKEGLQYQAAQCLRWMARAIHRQGELKKGMDTIQAAKEEFASIGDPKAHYGELKCMIQLGRWRSSDGQHEEAQEQFLQASELLKTEFPERFFQLAQLLSYLAEAAFDLGDLDSATSLAEEALAEMKRLGSVRDQGRVLRSLGKILLKKNEIERSISVLEESIPLLSRSGEQTKLAKKLLEQAYNRLNMNGKNLELSNEPTSEVV